MGKYIFTCISSVPFTHAQHYYILVSTSELRHFQHISCIHYSLTPFEFYRRRFVGCDGDEPVVCPIASLRVYIWLDYVAMWRWLCKLSKYGIIWRHYIYHAIKGGHKTWIEAQLQSISKRGWVQKKKNSNNC